MGKSKRRKKKKRTGFLKQMTRPISPPVADVTVADMLSGKVDMTSQAREGLQKIVDSVFSTPEASLIEEARGYGYALKKILDFYIGEHEDYNPADYMDDSDLENGMQNNLDFLKQVETWDDFSPFLEELFLADEADEADEADGNLWVPPEMLSLIIVKRMTHAADARLAASVKDLEENEVLEFLVAENIRMLKGITVAVAAEALEMPPHAYHIWIDALRDRATPDQMQKVATITHRHQRKLGSHTP